MNTKDTLLYNLHLHHYKTMLKTAVFLIKKKYKKHLYSPKICHRNKLIKERVGNDNEKISHKLKITQEPFTYD